MEQAHQSTDTNEMILVVDDIPENLDILNIILEENGYDIRPAINGEMALDFMQVHRPNLILLDIKMPGIDGFEVCRRVKADDQLKDIPIIFLSALNDMQSKLNAFEYGGVDYITKPFLAEEVLLRVKTHLFISQIQATANHLSNPASSDTPDQAPTSISGEWISELTRFVESIESLGYKLKNLGPLNNDQSNLIESLTKNVRQVFHQFFKPNLTE